ncbi:MAG: hypothetical protein JEZ09_15425 [Salinivirgaceae bacterium]|nr:hypothetical protein [Salinivirgaceae bacterium]
MELPNLVELKDAWYSCQDQDPVSGGYYAIIDDHGMKIPFCADDLDEWKTLWPAFIFKEALWDDYDFYDEDELKEAQKLLDKFEHVQWNDSDFISFCYTSSIHDEITIDECGKAHENLQNMVDKLRDNMG